MGAAPQGDRELTTIKSGDQAGSSAQVIYILYLVGAVLPIATLVGVIMAYIYRADAPDWVYSHYRFQIRTFWIGMLYVLIGIVLLPLVIGFLVLLLEVVWVIVRTIIGVQHLERGDAHPNPGTWMFS